MANRPVYIVTKTGVQKTDVDFTWIKGMALSQKQKNVLSFHKDISKQLNILENEILEVSTKSINPLGYSLSAFNLKTKTKKELEFSVESAFQSSKVFTKGGPYKDLFYADARTAKKDSRLQESGDLLHFEFFNNKVELNLGTMFYDWLYINTLLKNPDLIKEISKYSAFTDIEFNPKKSFNTQAFSVALFICLQKNNVDMTNFSSIEDFKEKTRDYYGFPNLFHFV